MLKNMSKLLTGDLLKILCDMGHGDSLVLADGNFPGATVAAKRLLYLPGLSTSDVLDAIMDVFPLDYDYTDYPASVMDLTGEDKRRGMPTPVAWGDFRRILSEKGGRSGELGMIERFDFYEQAKRAYAIIQTGESRQYGNLLLVKGVVL